MARNRKVIRNQLHRQLRDLYIFEDRFIKEQKLKDIALFHGISVGRTSEIIKHQSIRYAHTFNYIRHKIFKLPPVEITPKDMQSHDVFVATESWINLQTATVGYFLRQTRGT